MNNQRKNKDIIDKIRDMRVFIENNNIKDVFILLKDPNFDPSFSHNESIGLSSQLGCYEITELLLSDKRVDPSSWNNWAIKKAFDHGHYDIVDLLWKNIKVQNIMEKISA